MTSADAGTELVRAIGEALSGLDLTVTVEAASSQRWTSITFAGARHQLRLQFTGPSASAAVPQLESLTAEDRLHLRGHLLVELAAEAQDSDTSGVQARFRAVTVETDGF